jgi:hypothetical protein
MRRITFALRVFGNVGDEQNFLGSERFARLDGERVFQIVSVSNGVMLRAKMASLQADAGESARSRIAWRLLPFLFLLYVAN